MTPEDQRKLLESYKKVIPFAKDQEDGYIDLIFSYAGKWYDRKVIEKEFLAAIDAYLPHIVEAQDCDEEEEEEEKEKEEEVPTTVFVGYESDEYDSDAEDERFFASLPKRKPEDPDVPNGQPILLLNVDKVYDDKGDDWSGGPEWIYKSMSGMSMMALIKGIFEMLMEKQVCPSFAETYAASSRIRRLLREIDYRKEPADWASAPD